MDLKFVQDLHNKQFATRDSLSQRASTIIAALTTLSGSVIFVAVNFKPAGAVVAAAFWLLTAASGILLGIAGYYLIRSYNVPPLNDLAKPTEWLAYWNELKGEVAAGKIASAETEFTDYVLQQYAEIGDHNIDVNFKRGTRLVRSNNFLLASFVAIVVTALVFYSSNYILGEKPLKGVPIMLSNDALFCLPASGVAEQTLKRNVELRVNEDAFMCMPASQVFDATKPKPRPEPLPAPMPGPPRR